MSASDIYPLRLAPAFHRRIWGGGRLWALHRHEPSAAEAADPVPVGESWLMDDDSLVTDGEHAGRRLAEVAARLRERLVGTASTARYASSYGSKVPLLAKFLDPAQDLSIQVHPNDAYALAREAHTGHLGKTEAWYVVDAAPGASLLLGFKREVSAAEVREAVAAGTLEALMGRPAVAAGDVVALPAGTVHAAGGGTLLFEIQQASDITYRLYDFGRLGPDGRPRELHLEKALEVASLGAGPKLKPPPVRTVGRWRELARLEQFTMQHLELSGDEAPLGETTGPESLDLLVVISGRFTVEAGGSQRELAQDAEPGHLLRQGDALLLPAALGEYRVSGAGELIRCAVVRPRLPG